MLLFRGIARYLAVMGFVIREHTDEYSSKRLQASWRPTREHGAIPRFEITAGKPFDVPHLTVSFPSIATVAGTFYWYCSKNIL